MHRRLTLAAALLIAGAGPLARAQTSPPAWKQIYENGQVAYYVDSASLRTSGEFSVTSLLEYKIPQVVNGSQVWSMVTHMKLNCGQDQMVTTDNTFYALKMGAGPVVQSQPANDTWHPPQPDSLGGLIWATACGKP